MLFFVLGLSYYNYTGNEPNISNLKQKEINLIEQLKDRAEIINQLQTKQDKRVTVAVSTIGAFSYYTDATVIDMLGLTDVFIAHHPEIIPEISNDAGNPWKEKKYNSDYILKRKPDYIIFATIVKPSSYAERALFTKREFFHDYFVQFIPASSDRRYFFYTKKNQAQVNYSGNQILKEQINPEYVKHYVKLAEDLSGYLIDVRSEKLMKIKLEFEETKKTYPSFFSDHFRILGDAYFTADDMFTSAQYYEKSIAVDSLNVISYLGLCSVYQRLEKPEKVNYCIEKIDQFHLADDRLIRN